MAWLCQGLFWRGFWSPPKSYSSDRVRVSLCCRENFSRRSFPHSTALWQAAPAEISRSSKLKQEERSHVLCCNRIIRLNNHKRAETIEQSQKGLGEWWGIGTDPGDHWCQELTNFCCNLVIPLSPVSHPGHVWVFNVAQVQAGMGSGNRKKG